MIEAWWRRRKPKKNRLPALGPGLHRGGEKLPQPDLSSAQRYSTAVAGQQGPRSPSGSSAVPPTAVGIFRAARANRAAQWGVAAVGVAFGW